MGAVAAVAGALAGLFALVTYLYGRHDKPSAARERRDKKLADELEEFDEALVDRDTDALAGGYAGLYDDLDMRLRPRPGGNNSGGQDNVEH